ncbi:hypothetical protein [Christiangramia sp.]|uniref:hypothetical protein n=1 Tax=Christiangramia sp. TaxID=1931228 RepID=UPI00262256B3|nr:hypothetical protein [Christiangramia sp.]
MTLFQWRDHIITYSMNNPNSSNNSAFLEIQRPIVKGFQELKKVTEGLSSRTNKLGWKQRNVLISHVYSDYQKHHQLEFARKEWEEVSWKYNVHLKLYELMREYRDIYGYFPEYVEMFSQIDVIIDLAGKQDEFEIAQILVNWRKRLSR